MAVTKNQNKLKKINWFILNTQPFPTDIWEMRYLKIFHAISVLYPQLYAIPKFNCTCTAARQLSVIEFFIS